MADIRNNIPQRQMELSVLDPVGWAPRAFNQALTWLGGWFGGGNVDQPGQQLNSPYGDYGGMADSQAMQVSTVFACVRLITETIGTLSINVYERTPPPPDALIPPADAELVLEPTSPGATLPGEPTRAPDDLPPLPDVTEPPLTPIEPDPVVPFEPSPQPTFLTVQDPQNAAEIALETDPVTKLKLFLQANPDVATLIEENVPPPTPDPEPKS